MVEYLKGRAHDGNSTSLQALVWEDSHDCERILTLKTYLKELLYHVQNRV